MISDYEISTPISIGIFIFSHICNTFRFAFVLVKSTHVGVFIYVLKILLNWFSGHVGVCFLAQVCHHEWLFYISGRGMQITTHLPRNVCFLAQLRHHEWLFVISGRHENGHLPSDVCFLAQSRHHE